MTTPTQPDQQALAAYAAQAFAGYDRWNKKAATISRIVGGVTVVVVLLLMSMANPEKGAVNWIAAFAVAFVAMVVTFQIVLPRLPMPVVRCPYCAGRVPAVASVVLRRNDLVKICPSCSAKLPV